jgi:predicted nucleic acid-binding protein
MNLVDSDVMIEVQRKQPAAVAWSVAMSTSDLSVPGPVAIELVIGSRDKAEMARARQFVDSLQIVWPSEADHALALDLATDYRLTTGLGFVDFLIAAQAINHEATLFTFNLKHFGRIQGVKAESPYAR